MVARSLVRPSAPVTVGVEETPFSAKGVHLDQERSQPASILSTQTYFVSSIPVRVSSIQVRVSSA